MVEQAKERRRASSFGNIVSMSVLAVVVTVTAVAIIGGCGCSSGVVLASAFQQPLVQTTTMTIEGGRGSIFMKLKRPPVLVYRHRDRRYRILQGTLDDDDDDNENDTLGTASQSNAAATATATRDNGDRSDNDGGTERPSLFGGNLKRIALEGEEDDSFLASLSVPTYAAFSSTTTNATSTKTASPPPPPPPTTTTTTTTPPKKMGLEGIIPGAFLVHDAVPLSQCDTIIQTCESPNTETTLCGFGEFDSGKNRSCRRYGIMMWI